MMRCMNLARVAQELDVEFDGAASQVAGISIDSRKVSRGDLFVALPGARVDGHDYVNRAADQGAIAAIIEKPVSAAIPCFLVENSLAAMSSVAKANRSAYSGSVVAITGSCGKTTVKNMCRSVFRLADSTVATEGNYNNEFGVPLTLARLGDDTRYAVVEMGAAGRGHITHLCQLARPTVSVVLNAMEAHLDGFGTIADVADIKAEIYDDLPAGGTAVINQDQPWAEMWERRVAKAGASKLTYSVWGGADVFASDIQSSGVASSRFALHHKGRQVAVELPLPGEHSVSNALAAASLALGAGIDLELVAQGLAATEGEAGRLQAIPLTENTTLIDDSYNANPGSVRAAIAYLKSTFRRPALILGEMLELGEETEAKHREMGELAREAKLHRLVGVGEMLKPAVAAFGPAGSWCAGVDDVADLCADLVRSCDAILVKGSRGAAMERVVATFRSAKEFN
ncbi:MAG: UDP-N-acetylmuramoyl-tripeptide--D-alanyl-D-alanine ligase [Pseudomonadota bacterium]